MKASMFNIYKMIDNSLIIFNTMTQELQTINLLTLKNESKVIKNLENDGMLIEDSLDELKVYSFWRNKEVHSENQLSVVLLLNDANMESDECILRDSLDIISFLTHKLSSKNLKLVIMVQNAYPNIKLINYISEYLKKLKEIGIIYDVSLDLSGCNISNEIIKIMKQNNIHCNILVSKNNWIKYRINEEELYNNIIKNILMLIENKIMVSLEGHFYDLSINKIKRALNEIPVEHRKKIKIFIDSTINGLYKIDRNIYCEMDILDRILCLTGRIYKLGYPVSFFDSECFQCGARVDNSLVIDSKGSVYKCRYHINVQTEICNIRDNRDRITQQVIASRLSRLACKTERSCSKCTVLPLCKGGCLLEHDTVNGAVCNKLYYIELVKGFIKIKAEN